MAQVYANGTMVPSNKSIFDVVVISNSNPIPVSLAVEPTINIGTVLIAAGNNAIGTVYTNGAMVANTPTLVANNYSNGNVIGGILTFPSILSPSNFGVVESISLTFKNTIQTGTYDVAIFTTSPGGTYTDHANAAISNTDSASLVGIYALTNYSSILGSHTIYNLDGINKTIIGSSSNLYCVVVAATGTTANTTSNTDMSLRISTIW